MNTLWGPYKLSGATCDKIKERMLARQGGDRKDSDPDSKRLPLSVLPTIAEHSGLELLSKSLGDELKDWDIPPRPSSPDSILERAESESPSSSANSDKSEDLDGEPQEIVEADLASPTSPLDLSLDRAPASPQAKAMIWSPAPVSVQPFSPEFWSTCPSPSKPSSSVWSSLDAPSSKPVGLWTAFPSPQSTAPASKPESPEPLPLSPITSPVSSPPIAAVTSIFASVPNNAPSSRSMQAGRVPILEREFSFKLGGDITAAPLSPATAKPFPRSLSLSAADSSKTQVQRPLTATTSMGRASLQQQAHYSATGGRPASAGSKRALGKLSSFSAGSSPSQAFRSPGSSPAVSPRGPMSSQGGSFSQHGTPPKRHHWCWRCGQRGDLATRCLVCTGSFAVCRGCAHERAAKGRRPDTCLCGGCMSKPIDPETIARIQKMKWSSQPVTQQGSGGNLPSPRAQGEGGDRQIAGARNTQNSR